MGIFDFIENPTARAAACVVGAPLCLADHVAEQAGARAERVYREGLERYDELREDAPGLIDRVTGGVERVTNAATEPLDRLSSIMMWGAIALGIVAALIVLGVLLYFAWPFLVGIRSA